MPQTKSKMRILLLDIETSPNKVYTWGLWDQNIGLNQIEEVGYTMCWAAKWLDSREVLFNSTQMEKRKGEMIKEIHSLLEEADAVVHYNGKKFDIPTLNKEFILAGLQPPSPYKEIDLLRVARQRFRFQSNRLEHVASVLDIGTKTKHMGMDTWRKCMEGDEKAWRLMERYNKQDVKLLEKVYQKMLPWIAQHPNHGLYVDTDRPVCKNCGSPKVIKKGFEFTGVGKYQRYKCKNCGAPLRGATLLNTAAERKKLLR